MAVKKINEFNIHQNPATNTDMFDIENYLNANWNKIKDVVDNNADELEESQNNIANIQQEQTEQNESMQNNITSISQLQEENTLLEQNCLHNTEKGEIITVQDSAKWKKNKIGVFGYSEQETREGYNLLNVSNPLSVTKFTWIDLPLKAGTYTICTSNIVTDGTDITSYLVRFMTSKETGEVASSWLGNNVLLKTITLSQDVVGLYIYSANGASQSTDVTTTYSDLMILSGTYTAETIPPYEPYGAMPSPEFKSDVQSVSGNLEFVRCGKNFANEKDLLGTYLSDGYYSLTIDQLRNYANSKFKAIKKFKANTQYAISLKGYFSNGTWAYFRFYYTDGTYSSKSLPENTEASYSFISEAGKTIDYISFNSSYYHSSKSVFIKENTLQIEEKVATDYEQYNENRYNFTLEDGQEICAIKTTDEKLANYVDENGQMWIADYLADDGIHKRMPCKVFDGTENWLLTSSESMPYIILSDVVAPKNNTITATALCTHYKVIERKYLKDKYFAISYGKALIFYDEEHKNSLDTWKAYLAEEYAKGTPVTIKYVSSSEETIPYTTEQPKQYDKLQEISMQKGTNNLYSTNEFMKNMSLTYMRDTQMYIDNKDKEQDERITAIEELLSTTATSAMLLDNLESDLESEV